MPQTRILSLWFPRLAAERLLRQNPAAAAGPFAVVANDNNSQSLASLNLAAEQKGLHQGQALRDARAFCPELITKPANPLAEADFLISLRRWAGRYTPWVAVEPPAALLLDITGCAHLFGGEAALIDRLQNACASFDLTVQTGLADTPGAAWALARFAGQLSLANRSGDDINQEARATRSRAARRHWTRGGAAPKQFSTRPQTAISAPGQTRQALAGLPVTALRLPNAASTTLNRLGIRRIQDLLNLPRAALARRFGRDVLQRLDQALGVEPEPISPARPEHIFATRLTLPDPIGLEEDLMAAIKRLLPPLCEKLKSAGKGTRRIRLQLLRSDHSIQTVEVGLARPSHDAAQILPLLALRLVEVDAGFGIDIIRIEANNIEPLHPVQHSGHQQAATLAIKKLASDTDREDLLSRLGGRITLEAITCLHPANSHIPEKTANVLAAAWAEPAYDWPNPPSPRPLILFSPEIVVAEAVVRQGVGQPPLQFRWRRRDFRTRAAIGPERLAPEWWLADAHWRSGTRDYWSIKTSSGEHLWLYFAHGGDSSGGWFCQGSFA